jgi:hypothetical protein
VTGANARTQWLIGVPSPEEHTRGHCNPLGRNENLSGECNKFAVFGIYFTLPLLHWPAGTW